MINGPLKESVRGSVEEALSGIYLAGVTVRRVQDITWGSKGSLATISEQNTKAYVHIEDWLNRPLPGDRHPYIYMDNRDLWRDWGGERENVTIPVAIAVNETVKCRSGKHCKSLFCQF